MSSALTTKCTIEKAKIRNCDSEIKIISHFAFQPFQVFGSRLFASFFLHLRKQEGGRVVKALDIKTTMSIPLWVRSPCVSVKVSRLYSQFFGGKMARGKNYYRTPPLHIYQ
jgi:hypothetical protein